MAFDMGWNFRLTSDYVTDDAHYGVFANYASAYPTTFTNGDGQSINAGWANSPGTRDSVNRANTNDPRIAGTTQTASQAFDFQIDLSSGSAPGAGQYVVDFAIGAANTAGSETLSVKDDTTVLIDATNGGTSFTTASGHFYDATVTDVTASTTWTGTTVLKTFASTTGHAIINPGGASTANNNHVAHFRLTLQDTGQQQALSDTLGLTEQLRRQAGTTLAAALSLTEGLQSQSRKMILETVALTESLTRRVLHALSGESVSLTENLQALKVIVKPLSETVLLSENLGRIIQRTKALAETETFSETVTRLVRRTIGETVGLTETQHNQARRTMAELVTFTEQLVEGVIKQKALSDGLALNEADQQQIGKILQEALGLTETRLVQIARRFDETVLLAEVLQTLLIPSGGFTILVRVTQEAYGLPRAHTEAWGLSRATAEAFAASA